ncbi:MAG: flagellar motor switch protein FliN [bacterium]
MAKAKKVRSKGIVPAAAALFKEKKKTKKAEPVTVKRVEFPELQEVHTGEKVEKENFGNIPVQVTVELGKAEMTLKEVLDMAEGSLVPLNRLAGEPLDLKVSGQLIAQGEVVAIDNNYGIRVTSVIVK